MFDLKGSSNNITSSYKSNQLAIIIDDWKSTVLCFKQQPRTINIRKQSCVAVSTT
ncbi:hypothetical protein Hanom_Chr03g00220401 [Helianthus anomalus]